MRVYAWVNIPHGAWLRDHPDWVAVLSSGEPADAHAPGHYFYRVASPARVVREEECVSLLRELFAEVASLGFDGVDVNDNFQFPDWYVEEEDLTLYSSYDEFTVSAFEEDAGVDVPGSSPREWAEAIESDPGLWGAWVRWRAEQVTRLIEIVVEAVREVDPDLEVRPHLLIWDPLETYGLDYRAIARLTGALYVMVSSPHPEDYVRAVSAARRAGASKVVASVYLSEAGPGELARVVRRPGADELFVYDFELIEEEGLWDEIGQLVDAFLESREMGWIWSASIASVYFYPEEDLSELEEAVSEVLDQGASVVKLDVGLSNYEVLYGPLLDSALEAVSRASELARSRGARVVVYLPALEVISPPGSSFYRDHPEWVQRSLDCRPLVASGGELGVPWLEEGEEDAWASPLSPHADL
ncbi:MAG: hypothetical protein DRO06_02020, partial [Thermoproteota archaeon]